MAGAQAIRTAIKEHTGQVLPTPPPPPRIQAFGRAELTQRATLLSQLSRLYPGDGIVSEQPLIMEEYGQPCAPLGPSDWLRH